MLYVHDIAASFCSAVNRLINPCGGRLVNEVITIMGQPEDYLVDDEIFEDEPQPRQRQSTRPSKKLYRDTVLTKEAKLKFLRLRVHVINVQDDVTYSAAEFDEALAVQIRVTTVIARYMKKIKEQTK
jgi:hypothetical protein